MINGDNFCATNFSSQTLSLIDSLNGRLHKTKTTLIKAQLTLFGTGLKIYVKWLFRQVIQKQEIGLIWNRTYFELYLTGSQKYEPSPQQPSRIQKVRRYAVLGLTIQMIYLFFLFTTMTCRCPGLLARGKIVEKLQVEELDYNNKKK